MCQRLKLYLINMCNNYVPIKNSYLDQIELGFSLFLWGRATLLDVAASSLCAPACWAHIVQSLPFCPTKFNLCQMQTPTNWTTLPAFGKGNLEQSWHGLFRQIWSHLDRDIYWSQYLAMMLQGVLSYKDWFDQRGTRMGLFKSRIPRWWALYRKGLNII